MVSLFKALKEFHHDTLKCNTIFVGFLSLTGLAMEEFQSATVLHHKKIAQDASRTQQLTLSSSLWSVLFMISSVLIDFAVFRDTLTWWVNMCYTFMFWHTLPGYQSFGALITRQTMWFHKPEDCNLKMILLYKLKILYKVLVVSVLDACCYVSFNLHSPSNGAGWCVVFSVSTRVTLSVCVCVCVCVCETA